MNTTKPQRSWRTWDPLCGDAVPRGRDLVEITAELFDLPAKKEFFAHGSLHAVHVWSSKAIYMTPTRHPAKLRALLRTWGGYDPEGQDPPNADYRDFAENHIPALIVEKASDTQGWIDLLLAPAMARALVVTPRSRFDLSPLLFMQARPDWVIVRGPSGPDAWPMHPTWVQAIRDVCKAAGVPFAFRSWGDYVPETDAPTQINGLTKRRWAWQAKDCVGPMPQAVGEEGRWWREKSIPEWGSLREDGHYSKGWTPFSDEMTVYRVGPERTGCRLSGVLHDERPAAAR